jgi:hypothetical protein
MFRWRVVAPFFFKTNSQGAATSLLCAKRADPDKCGVEYFDNCKPTNVVSKMEDDAGKGAVERLWTATEDLLKTRGV